MRRRCKVTIESIVDRLRTQVAGKEQVEWWPVEMTGTQVSPRYREAPVENVSAAPKSIVGAVDKKRQL